MKIRDKCTREEVEVLVISGSRWRILGNNRETIFRACDGWEEVVEEKWKPVVYGITADGKALLFGSMFARVLLPHGYRWKHDPRSDPSRPSVSIERKVAP